MPPPRRSVPVRAINLALIAGSLLLVIVPAEFVFRHRYGHMLYNPRPAVVAVQQYLTLDPVVGFKWRPNIAAKQGVRFQINDMVTPPLSTDSFGVMNAPAAIADRAKGGHFDVVGLGDSFMEMAARGFYDRFQKKKLTYYSFAIHRQCPPQYNAILKSWAIGFKPKAIVYGLFENDFSEIADFQRWQRSGVDWFAYHSGTWCGPPIGAGVVERFVRTHARGWYAFGTVLYDKVRGGNMSVTGPSRAEIDAVVACIKEAATISAKSGARFVLVIIPSKPTATDGDTLESLAYNDVLRAIQGDTIDVVDLRSVFRKQPDPAALYYVKDGHWNDKGVAVAAAEILNHLESES